MYYFKNYASNINQNIQRNDLIEFLYSNPNISARRSDEYYLHPSILP